MEGGDEEKPRAALESEGERRRFVLTNSERSLSSTLRDSSDTSPSSPSLEVRDIDYAHVGGP